MSYFEKINDSMAVIVDYLNGGDNPFSKPAIPIGIKKEIATILEISSTLEIELDYVKHKVDILKECYQEFVKNILEMGDNRSD